MKIEEAIKTLKENGYLNVFTHEEEIQKQAKVILDRRLERNELEGVKNYIEHFSDGTIGVNDITIDAAIAITVNRKNEQPRIHLFFDRLRKLGLAEIFNWEHGEAGTLLQHYTIVAPNDKKLNIILMSKGRDKFYLYVSPNTDSIDDAIKLINETALIFGIWKGVSL